jgi:3-oxoacyl-[acyl-carrier protein] reductase
MIIISGGCGGVGKAVGKQLAEDGFDIVALYHTTPAGAAEGIARNFGAGNHRAIQCDVRDESEVERMINKITKGGEKIDAIIHAAVGTVVRKNILALGDAQLRDQLAVSFFGGFYLFKAASPHMLKGGRIIGILSQVVIPGNHYPGMAGVTIGKYALRGLLKELHGELLPREITVNAIAPDFMDTPLNKDLPEAVRTFIAERAAKGSIKSPGDVARVASFLCSDAGKTINGKLFSFDKTEVSDL